MDFKYKQLEHELSALSRVFGELGARLSEVAKDVTSPGVTPPEKLIEQISTARTNFDNVRGAVHGHAAAMLVSPLPKIGEVVSVAAIDTLLKASAVAEENKVSIETERDRALSILSRVLAITHKETADFKPLQECHARVDELRNGISKVAWPHRHAESETVTGFKHPATALLSFVENLDTLEDDRWISLEATITDTYGKPLFVAASRGKLVAPKPPSGEKPPAAAPAPAVEKKTGAERAPEKPVAPAAHAPAAHAPAAHAPVAHVEKKVTPAPAPAPVAATPQKPAAPAVTAEKKDGSEKPQAVAPPPPPVTSAPTPAVTPVIVNNAAPAPATPAPAAVAPTPAAPVAPVAPAPLVAQAPAAATTVAAAPAAPPVAATPAASAPAPQRTPAPPAVAPPVPAAAPAPIAAAASPAPAPVAQAAPVASAPASAATSTAPTSPAIALAPNAATPQTNIPSLAALATATEPAAERKPATIPIEGADKLRKEPRLASPAPQPAAKAESKPQEADLVSEQGQGALAGDGSQRPQRWGFWQGNR